MLFQQAKDLSLWNDIRNTSKYQEIRLELEQMYRKYCTHPIEVLRYSEFKLYENNGSRKEYEASYFKRRGRLNTLAALALIYGKEEKYLRELEDIIWAICDEFTWALPAHLSMVASENQPVFIDLFAAETGFALAEIQYLLSDRLSVDIIRRLKYELCQRIIQPFQRTKFWWEATENNWSAVCAGSVGAVFMYIQPDSFIKQQDRINEAMGFFLRSYMDDGACREGVSYWEYGFGFFVYYAQLLKEFSSGQVDWFKQEKIKTIAQFQNKSYLQECLPISFADVGNYRYGVGLACFLNRLYQTPILPKTCAAGLDDDRCHRWAAFIRSLAWRSEDGYQTGLKKESIYFKNSEIFIVRKDSFAFAAKCGCNAEPHNHNDVGGFIFAADGRQVLYDFGSGEYIKSYFSEDTRYNFLVNSSRGHNLPIINHQYQKSGEKFAGRVIHSTDKIFEIDIAGAYDIQQLNKLIRRFTVEDDFVEITDSYEFSTKPESIVERLVTLFVPEFEKGVIRLGNTVVLYSDDVFECQCHSENFQNHYAQNSTAYLIDLNVKKISDIVETKIVVKTSAR